MILSHHGKVFRIIRYDKPCSGDWILAVDEDHASPAIWQTHTDWPEESGAFILEKMDLNLL